MAPVGTAYRASTSCKLQILIYCRHKQDYISICRKLRRGGPICRRPDLMMFLGPQTEVIVNTISENLDLNQGGVSKAILGAAGAGLQSAVLAEARAATLQHGEVAITGGFNLACREVFHVVCPAWDNGGGQAEQVRRLFHIICYCLEAAEKRKMRSLSFPAIGTGNLSFPRDVVSRVLHSEIHAFSRRRSTRHLRAVVIVVHPGDTQTCFTREFKGQAGQRHVQHEAQESPAVQPLSQSQPTSGEKIPTVSSGDITKEASDVIVNSSNQDFNLKTGVSKAILDSAGTTVETECSRKVKAPGYLPGPLIITSAGLLPSRAIVHVVGQSDPAKIKDVVYSVLKVCEEKKFCSVSFPALGTGQGGANPTAVADAMVEAVVEFVRKKHPRFVHCVKILIFQTTMMTEFHKSMKQREGEEVEAKSVFTKFKGDDALPPRWEAMKGDLVKLFPLTLGSQEYSEVVQEFTKTSLTANIISIERVQNVTLWQSYQLMKKQLEVKNKHTNNEKLLFHGTGANAIGLINDKGFNRSYAGVHGAMFGNGSYFAVDPAYSAQGYAKPDASGHKRIYLSRVLVGDYTLGRGGLITPPSKGSVNAADLYDSVADNPANPTMFVVFNDIQAYPEYLITFT
uniref:Poly [ADP-ribose] polymerase n=1 Tax=Scophthalmus maximus TaxID=52904 RepID=A0A8D3B381_SCOMX